MNRRGFFSKLFNSNEIAERFFFGFQIVINEYAKENLGSELRAIIASGPENNTPRAKKNFYRRLIALIQDCFFAVEYGFWDYIDDFNDSLAEYENWINELESSITLFPEGIVESVEDVIRLSADKSYIAVSMLFLLEGDYSQKRFVDMLNSIEEDNYYDKQTFERLLENINYINFDYSYSDASFIVPGNDQEGLSWEDIHGDGWQYLKPVL